MNFSTIFKNFFMLSMNTYSLLIFYIILPVFVYILSKITFNVPFELKNTLKQKKFWRFCKLFFGWVALTYFTIGSTYALVTQDELSPAIPQHIDESTSFEQQQIKSKSPSLATSNSPTIAAKVAQIHRYISVIFVSILLFIYCWYKENPTNPVYINKHWKYHESIRPSIRFWLKIGLGILIFGVINFILVKYPALINSHYKHLFSGATLLSFVLLYQNNSYPYRFGIFQSPNEFEINRKFLNLIPFFTLFFSIIFNERLLNIFLQIISLPWFSFVLTIVGLGLAYLGVIGISFSKTHQLNPHLRSIVSYPIAIQLKDRTTLNKQQIYDAITNCCPDCQIYYEWTSKMFKETKAEIVVLDWQQYKEHQIEDKIKELNIKIIEALLTKSERPKRNKELEILNFIIERRHDGHIENIIPIKNKKIVQFLNLVHRFRLLISKSRVKNIKLQSNKH